MKTFKFRESLKKSWELYKKNWQKLVLTLIGFYIILAGIEFLSRILIESANGLSFLSLGFAVDSIGTVIRYAIIVGMISLYLRLHDNHRINWGDLKTNWKSWAYVFIVQMIVALGICLLLLAYILPFVLVGVLLYFAFGVSGNVVLIVLGIIAGIGALGGLIYLSARLSFLIPWTIENYEDMGIIEIIKTLWQKTGDYTWSIIKLNIKNGLLLALGILALGIGLLVTIPLATSVWTDFYRTFINSKK